MEGVSLLLWPWPLQRQLSQIRPRLDCFLVAPEDPLASGPSMSGDRRRLGRGDDTSNESTMLGNIGKARKGTKFQFSKHWLL